jgi:hypothetical protein
MFYRRNIDEIWARNVITRPLLGHWRCNRFPINFPTCLVRCTPLLTPVNFPFVTSLYSYFLIDVAQIMQIQRNGWALPIHDAVLNPFLRRTNRVLPYWRICIRSRRSHPGTPMDTFHPLFFQHNTFSLNRNQRIASYSLSPFLMVWAVSDIILSLLAERLCQTPGLQFGPSVLLHCLITYFYTINSFSIIYHSWDERNIHTSYIKERRY